MTAICPQSAVKCPSHDGQMSANQEFPEAGSQFPELPGTSRKSAPLTLERIAQAVCEATGLTREEVFSPCRRVEYVNARRILALLLKEWRPAMSDQTLADYLGKSDPSSAWHIRKQGCEQLTAEPTFKAAYESAKEKLNN